MLPRVHPEQHLDVRSSRRDFRSLTTHWAPAARSQGRVGILLLLPVMRARQRRAGEVGGQDGELGILAGDGFGAPLYEPDEAGAEHGVCGGDHGRAEVFEGVVVTEGFGEEGGEVLGGGGRVGGEGGEELVVVPGHGGVVEEGCSRGVSGVGDEDVFC